MKKLIIILFISLAFQVARSQSSVSQQLVGSGGGQTDNAVYHTSWSVGECVTATASAGPIVLTQGFQQRNCENPTTPGTIGSAQTICYDTKPATFTNVTSPGGRTGTIEYQWQTSTGSHHPTPVFSGGGDGQLFQYTRGCLAWQDATGQGRQQLSHNV